MRQVISTIVILVTTLMFTAPPAMSMPNVSNDTWNKSDVQCTQQNTPVLQLVTWRAGEGEGGHYISDGNTKIFMKTKKKARKAAKKFNKIEKEFKAEDPDPDDPTLRR